MTTPTTFHPFPRLPAELRLKIWGFTYLEPRSVTIACKKGKLSRDVRFAEAFTSSTPPPTPLHVCRESRYDALAVYTPMFKTNSSERYTYINVETDILRCSDSVLEYLGDEEVKSVRRMELEVRDPAYFGHFNMDTIHRMKNLKIVALECAKSIVYSWSRGGMYVETLTGDFEQQRASDPGWVCPEVVIVKRETGEILHTIASGAMIPGWRHGDPYPDEV